MSEQVQVLKQIKLHNIILEKVFILMKFIILLMEKHGEVILEEVDKEDMFALTIMEKAMVISNKIIIIVCT